MKLIDLDQTIVVPVEDETRGTSYEMQMSVAEFFEKFLDGFEPEIVDAIPMEWIEWRIAHAEREGFGAVVSMLRKVRDWWNDQRDVWQKEQEAR